MIRKRLPLLLLFVLLSFTLPAQLTGWSYKATVDAAETSGVSHTNYQMHYVFDSQALIGAGKLQANGGDLRFGDPCGSTLYPYWIESGLNTANTEVWILLPSVPANSTTSFAMFYGNPSAPDGNNFAATFPGAIRTSGGNLTITGTLTPDFVWAEPNDTIFLTAGAVLTLSNVRKLRVDALGQIRGVGRGFQAPVINTAGTGPGGGGTSTNSGCGGGGYGGNGGLGGLDAGDTPGAGGLAYGTAAGTDCQMGSSGGSGTGISTGGHGGGAIDVTVEYVEINGSIDMSGSTPASDGTGRGGGGGAGGCIKIICATATGTGTLTASGTNGAAGTSTNNDSGGGGGGGRVKTFSQAAWPGTLILTAAPGLGGPYGTQAPGQPGLIGSTSSTVQTFAGSNPTGTTGLETAAGNAAGITGTGTVVCTGGSLLLTATSGMVSYSWSTGDTISSTTITVAGSYTVDITDSNGCNFSDTVVVTASSAAPMVITGAGTVCGGSCDTLTASAGFASYFWNTSATTATILACSSGTYIVEGTDSNTCVSSDTFVVTVLPINVINTPPVTACDGNFTLLDASGPYVSWIWSTGDTTSSIVVSTSGSYGVTTTDANGCITTGTFVVTYVPLPTPTLVQNGNLLSVTPSYPAYQWLLNGSPITGETNPTYTVTTTGIYSVQVVDVNGCIGTSDTTTVIVGIHDPVSLGASLYPNPTRNSSILLLNLDAQGEVDVLVVDAVGKVVMQRKMQAQAGTNRLELPLGEFAAGMYQVKVSDGKAQQVLRLLKQ